jgi:hypothetical protein
MKISSFHLPDDLDARNAQMAMEKFLMMNDMNDNYVDDVHELFQAYDEFLDYNELLIQSVVSLIVLVKEEYHYTMKVSLIFEGNVENVVHNH